MPIDPTQMQNADANLLDALKRWHAVMHGEAPESAVRGIGDLADLFESQDIASIAWNHAKQARDRHGPDSPQYETAVQQWIEAARIVANAMPESRAVRQEEIETGERAVMGYVGEAPQVVSAPPGYSPQQLPDGRVIFVPTTVPAPAPFQPQSVIIAPSVPRPAAPAPAPLIVQTHKKAKKKQPQQRIVLLRHPTKKK